jgi:C-terminal processing protease CtpA/Prc
MRSWGGVVGIRGDKPTVDGGMLTQPEFAWWDPKQGWGLENRGVIPDIEVQNMPQDLAKGIDSQLDRAIAEVMMLHDKNPPIRRSSTPRGIEPQGVQGRAAEHQDGGSGAEVNRDRGSR